MNQLQLSDFKLATMASIEPTIRFSIYIPGKTGDGQFVNQNQWVYHANQFFLKNAGGTSQQAITGAWQDTDGNIIEENLVKVYSDIPTSTFNKIADSILLKFVLELAKATKQKVILYEIGSTPFYLNIEQDPIQETKPKNKVNLGPSVELVLEAKGVKAKGLDLKDGFRLLKGSQLVKQETPSIANYASMQKLRTAILNSGLLLDKGSYYELIEDYIMYTPSAAATVVCASSVNGLDKWNNNGTSLKKLRDES